MASLGPIDRWIPPGYDLYVIGLQVRDAVGGHNDRIKLLA